MTEQPAPIVLAHQQVYERPAAWMPRPADAVAPAPPARDPVDVFVDLLMAAVLIALAASFILLAAANAARFDGAGTPWFALLAGVCAGTAASLLKVDARVDAYARRQARRHPAPVRAA